MQHSINKGLSSCLCTPVPANLMRLLALLVLIVAGTAEAGSPLDVRVDAAGAKGFAGEILVTDRSQTIYARALSAPGRPHQRGELWRWASVTKQVTATLIMQLVVDGKLSLDDTLEQRLPAFKGASANRTTIRMLLQHTSQLPNPDDSPAGDSDAFPAFYRRNGPDLGGMKDALGYCAGKGKRREAGTFSYNNCDYIVLGAIIEKVTGKSYADRLQEKIAKPAGLSTIKLAIGGEVAVDTVRGTFQDGRLEPPFELATFGAAGAIVGSADDLAAFDRALLDHRLLPEAATLISWKGDPALGYVALGVWGYSASLKDCAGPVRLVERRGDIGGVEVRNLLAPDLGLAIVVFTDRAGWDFGEIWQGNGFTYDLASAAFCRAHSSPKLSSLLHESSGTRYAERGSGHPGFP
jgi:D-alanyl-D-alanine carboxypeptidase